MRPTSFLLAIFSLTGLSACTIRASNLQVWGGDANDTSLATCTWTTVSEVTTTTFLSLTLETKTRQFDDALFLCCPGADNARPECREAKWTERAVAQ